MVLQGDPNTAKPKYSSVPWKGIFYCILIYKCVLIWVELKILKIIIFIFKKKVDTSSFECRLEIQDPGPDTAGMYKCLVSNEKGEINANLMLNIQLAQRSVLYISEG